jgi:hypothetical protein
MFLLAPELSCHTAPYEQSVDILLYSSFLVCGGKTSRVVGAPISPALKLFVASSSILEGPASPECPDPRSPQSNGRRDYSLCSLQP